MKVDNNYDLVPIFNKQIWDPYSFCGNSGTRGQFTRIL